MEKDRAEHSNAAVPEQVLCMNCGGSVNPKLEQSHMSGGGEVEDETLDDDSLDVFSEPMPLEDDEDRKSKILSSIFGSKKSQTI